MPTVHEVWRLALPETTKLLNEGGDTTRPVSWAQRMAYRVPAFGGLERGEVVLLKVQDIRLLDERLTLVKLIRSLAEREIAALAVVGAVSAEARAVADLHGLCLFGLPDDACTTDIDVRDFWSTKQEATQCHATQLKPDSFFALLPAEEMRELQTWECFQLAASDGSGEDGSHDLFSGLR